VQHLLAFSRRQVLHPRPVQVNDAVRNIETMLARTLGNNVWLSLRLDESGPMVLVDPVQLDQVLLNMVINARDAMPTGGTVTVTTSTASGQVVITVEDTGTGMDEDTRARIFEPFFTTKGSAGTGLGLPTVYGIVKQSGGSVTCESTPGVGSVFRVSLPALEPAADPLAKVSA
jgi:two-component system, cell cycle sensor histidine kinase and response regulator CckA